MLEAVGTAMFYVGLALMLAGIVLRLTWARVPAFSPEMDSKMGSKGRRLMGDMKTERHEVASSGKAESIAGGACGDSVGVCASDGPWSGEDDSVSPLAKRLCTGRTAHCLFDSNRGAL